MDTLEDHERIRIPNKPNKWDSTVDKRDNIEDNRSIENIQPYISQ